MNDDLIHVDIYKDLESLLFGGFLTHSFVYNGTPYIFKSLTESEFEYINLKYFFVKDPELKFKYFMAVSILEIDQENLLPFRHEKEFMESILSLIKTWPPEFFIGITKVMDYFTERNVYSNKILEAYSYTDDSRMKWAAHKYMFLNDPKVTGYPGTDIFPLSSTQQSWIYINTIEDLRIHFEMSHDMARLSGSASNPEGMKKVSQDETQRRNQLKMYREQIKNQAGYGGSANYKYVESDQELVEKLWRMQRGEEDEHDKIVANYEKNIKQSILEEKRRREDIISSLHEKDAALPKTNNRGIRIRRELLDDDYKPPAEKVLGNVSSTDTQYGGGGHQAQKILMPDNNMVKKFDGMAKLSQEDEKYLRADLLDDLKGMKNLNDITIEEGTKKIRGPRLSDY